MNWIRKLLGLCVHKWKSIDKRPLYGIGFGGSPSRLPENYIYVLQCEHCGNLKKVTT